MLRAVFLPSVHACTNRLKVVNEVHGVMFQHADAQRAAAHAGLCSFGSDCVQPSVASGVAIAVSCNSWPFQVVPNLRLPIWNPIWLKT